MLRCYRRRLEICKILGSKGREGKCFAKLCCFNIGALFPHFVRFELPAPNALAVLHEKVRAILFPA
jgi:hypothetical protein